jgi:L-rhamnose isomerase
LQLSLAIATIHADPIPTTNPVSDMTTTPSLATAFSLAREQYAALGVDVDGALSTLRSISLSLHCWQGDDVRGFERHGDAASSGGIQVTGGYPGAARTIDELAEPACHVRRLRHEGRRP